MRDRRLRIWISLLYTMAMGAAVRAQSTRPAAPASEYDSQPIVRSTNSTATTQASAAQTALPKNPLEPQRVLLALAAVLGLIVALRFAARKLFPGVAAAKASQAVRVLARSPLSPKQQVLLLQIGRRVVVIADCGTQMNSLAEITDSDEVASLVGQINAEKTPATRKFAPLFGRARDRFDEQINRPQTRDESDETEATAEDAPAELGLATAAGELKGLMEKMRTLAQSLKR